MGRLLASLCALALASAGCSTTEFDPPELIEKDRPLAGRVSVVGDENRATPAPGESASYEVLVVSPGPQVLWTYVLAACRFSRGSDHIAVCDPDGAPIAQTALEGSQAMPPDTLPALTFQVPDAATLGPDEDELLVQGLLCPDSALDPGLLAVLGAGDLEAALTFPNPCADKSKNGLILSSPLRIERNPGDRNASPRIASVSWSQLAMKAPIASGTPWTSRAAALTARIGCQGQGFPELSAQKQPIGLQVELAPGSRETYEQRSFVPGRSPVVTVEVPRLFGYASAGEFAIVRDNQQADGQILQLTWRPPPAAELDATGTLVRFWLLAGDNRDVNRDAEAVSWTERALCLVR